MYVLNGATLVVDLPFTAGGVNYPDTWLRQSSPEDRAAIGIVEFPDPIRPNDQFYVVEWDAENLTYIKHPKDLTSVKDEFIAQIKSAAHSLLTPTDWMVIREVEEPGSMPAEKKAYRKAVRTRSSEIEVAINACVDVPMLEAFVTGDMAWPEEAMAPEKKTAGRRAKG